VIPKGLSLVVIVIVVYVLWTEANRSDGSVSVIIGDPVITSRKLGNV